MLNKIIKIFVSFALFFSFFTVFADYGFRLESQNWTSAKFSWDRQNGASLYYLKYYLEGDYNVSETDFFEENTKEVNFLEYWKKYYFNVIWVNDSGEEVFESSELAVEIWSEKSSFSILKSALVDEDILRISFSKKLDLSRADQVEFKIEAVWNPNDYLIIEDIFEVKNDEKSIDLKFDSIPTNWVEYSAIAIVVYDENWNNIKYGIDSETKFTWWDFSKVEEVENIPLNSAWLSEEIEEKNNEDEVKVESKVEEKLETTKSVVWTELNPEEVWKNVEKISEEKENLPQTWPEMFLILLLALIIPAWIFMFRKN